MAKHTAATSTQTLPVYFAYPESPGWETPPTSEDQVLARLRSSPLLFASYQGLNDQWRRHFLDFCQGKKSLPLTYDPFFKRIFHPDIHPDRLSRLVSSILGINVKVLHILPSEDSIISGGTLLIMDILAELEDGSLINVEIQKQAYAFPAERISCYCADLLMRQYARARGVKGKAFTYQDIKKVYVIVLFEKSTGAFHALPETYLHHGRTRFDTGLEMELLQEYFLISLDVFREFQYPKDKNEQTAWLSLLVTEDQEEAERLVQEYPWLQEIFEEIAMLRQKPEEVLGMFSEALRILDQNTIKYMIDELEKDLEEKEAVLREKAAEIKEKEAVLKEKDAAIKEKEAVIEEKDAVLKEKDAALKERDAALKERDAALKERDAKLEAATREKEAAFAEIARLKAQVAGSSAT